MVTIKNYDNNYDKIIMINDNYFDSEIIMIQ